MCSRVFYQTTKDRIIKPEIASGEPSSPSLIGGGNRATVAARRVTPPLFAVRACARDRPRGNARAMRAPCHLFALGTLPVTDQACFLAGIPARTTAALASFISTRARHAHEHIMKSTRARRSSLSRLRRHDATRCIGLAPLGFGYARVAEYSPCIPCAWRFV